MRQKVYYTIDEIINNLYTSGNELMYPDGTEYQGEYHRYITGETYTRKEWHPLLSKKLIPYENLNLSGNFYRIQNKNIKTKYKSITTHYPEVSSENINSGYITRYFVQNVTNLIITEIDDKQYQDYQKDFIDNNVYIALSLPWIITGNLKTQTINGAVVTGISETNKLTVLRYNKTMPGLISKLSNFIEFYTDNTFIIPEDINPPI